METYFVGSLFDGEKIITNQLIRVNEGKIVRIENSAKSDIKARNAHQLSGLLSPGFVDLQVNGGGGVLFNQAPSVETLQTIVTAHRAFGTTSLLATLITDQLSVIKRAADSVSELSHMPFSGVVGIHFEGPHLSVPKKGIHPESFIRSVSDAELAQYSRKDLGKVKVTVAPEIVPVDIIQDLVAQGVTVFLGHSNACADTVMQAIEAGASGFTHLFNAMSPITGREPGMVGCALLDDTVYCGLIVDLLHVHPLNCQLAIKTKSANKLILVTDAMGHVGSKQDVHRYFDTEIIRKDNKLTTPDGTIAGSNLDMASAVRNTHKELRVPACKALTMATTTPAECIGLADKIGRIAPGYQADFVLLDDDLKVTSTWAGGQRIFCAHE